MNIMVFYHLFFVQFMYYVNKNLKTETEFLLVFSELYFYILFELYYTQRYNSYTFFCYNNF